MIGDRLIMDTALQASLRPQSETTKIQGVIDRNASVLAGYHIAPVGELGYVLQHPHEVSRKYAESSVAKSGPQRVLMLDFDDTLAGTTAIKPKRQELYDAYLNKLGVRISDDDTTELMKFTDLYCRWQVVADGGLIYHPHAHASVLSWATDQVVTKVRGGMDPKTALSEVEAEMTRIKDDPKPTDPFAFSEDKRYITRYSGTWEKEIEDIFVGTMLKPDQFVEMIAAAGILANEGYQVEILTLGPPFYQLMKLVNLMKDHPELKLARLHLTQVPKGTYMKQLLASHPMLYLGDTQLTLVDDGPYELESFREAVGGRLVPKTVRVRRPNTRNYEKPDGAEASPVIDFTTPKDPEEIASAIKAA